jgi:hypothetical protein
MQTTVINGDTASITEIDEALTYARQLPPDQRGPAWHAFVDRLLEMRASKTTGATLAPNFTGPQPGQMKGAPK